MHIIKWLCVPAYLSSMFVPDSVLAEDLSHLHHRVDQPITMLEKQEISQVQPSFQSIPSQDDQVSKRQPLHLAPSQDSTTEKLVEAHAQHAQHAQHAHASSNMHEERTADNSQQEQYASGILLHQDTMSSKVQEDGLQVHSTAHLKAHGGQIFQASVLESQWSKADDGKAVLKSEFESRIGTDENKLYVQVHANKPESSSTATEAKLLYSRKLADYWDIQMGGRYRHEPRLDAERDQFDAVIGLQGLAPYFFETELYAFVGADGQYSLSLETERDLLLTQKWILKPYLDAVIVLNDNSRHAQKSGLQSWSFGLETRYEINKILMPFLDLAYAYDKGVINYNNMCRQI